MITSTSPRLSVAEHNRLRRAADTAKRLYPGPVGEWLSKELVAVDECGRAFGGEALAARLVDHLEAQQAERVAEAARVAFRGTASEVHR